MKHRKLLTALLVMTMVLSAACGAGGEGNAISTEAGEDMNYTNVEMTDREIELLCENYTDEDRIRNGQLWEHQYAALLELRACMGYLEQKYPGLTVEAVRFTPAPKSSQTAVLDVTVPGDSADYKVYLKYGADGAYIITETVYGHVLRPAYDERVAAVLRAGGIDAKCYTVFNSPAGDEIGPGTSVDELLAMGGANVRFTDLFTADTEDREALAAKAAAILAENGLYASYELDFAPGFASLTPEDLEAGRSGYEYVSFVCKAD